VKLIVTLCFFFLGALTMHGQTDRFLMIVESTTAQILLDQKMVGEARLPVGQEYEFLGLSGDRYLLRTGQTIFRVEPLATDYLERGLLTQLGWKPATIITAAREEEPAAQIYLPDPSPLEVRRTIETAEGEAVRPFRRIVQSRYAPGYFSPYFYGYPGCATVFSPPLEPVVRPTYSITIKID
jgi:hypothetical protein